MMTSVGRFTRQAQGKGYVAIVTLTIDHTATERQIAVDCHGPGFTRQGASEVVAEHGYDAWKRGAVVGVAYALDVAGLGPCRVTITKIEGLTTDTNATVVAVAAMDAIWKGIGFTPPAEIDTHVKAAALDSWKHPDNAIPEF